MSTIPISFYEREYTTDPDRAGLHETLKTMGLPVAHTWADQVQRAAPAILFFHGNDRSDLGTPESSGVVYHPMLKGVFKVEYGANPQSPAVSPWDADFATGYINWQSVRDGIAGFASDVAALPELDSETVHALITKHFFEFDVDPKLEELLKPFATSSPFKAPSSPQAKEKLDAYIATTLPKPKA